MADVVFPGTRGTGDWVTDQRPYNWREMILRLYPNGSAPLTAVMAKMKSEATDDPQFHWWEKELPSQYATLLGDGVYTAAWTTNSLGWSSAQAWISTDTMAANEVIYIALDAGASGSATDVAKVRPGHHITLLDSAIPSNYINCMATAVDVTLGLVTLKYLGEALATIPEAAFIEDLDTMMITGSMHAEGANTPASIAYDPTKFHNLTSIKRTSLDMTRTAMRTHLRTGEHVNQARIDALELHSIEHEKADIWGERWEGTDTTSGKPIRSSGGVLYYISTNVSDFANDSVGGAATSSWLSEGENWLDDELEQLFRYGSNEKLAFCGSGALLAINKLIKNRNYTGWDMTPMKAQYGIKVVQWTTPFGVVYLKNHPLMTQNAATRKSMIVLDTKFLTYRYLKGDDTKYLKDRQDNGVDGVKSEYLTESGLELHFEKAHGHYTNLGEDGVSMS